jgi:hypothetical protein
VDLILLCGVGWFCFCGFNFMMWGGSAVSVDFILRCGGGVILFVWI